MTDADDASALAALRSLPLESVTEPLAAVAFWSSIALPALYLPMLVMGIETPRALAVFLGLFGLHVVTLLAGRAHRRE